MLPKGFSSARTFFLQHARATVWEKSLIVLSAGETKVFLMKSPSVSALALVYKRSFISST
jgi:hypothetical protein